MTTLAFTLPEQAHVELSIYDLEGGFIETVLDDYMSQGYKEATWDGTDFRGNPVASGIYFCRLKAGDATKTRKLVVVK